MTIEDLKKELGISNKEIAEFFGFKNTLSYLNSSAKKRYEDVSESSPAQAVREFWAATFGCNNEVRQQELLAYWRAN